MVIKKQIKRYLFWAISFFIILVIALFIWRYFLITPPFVPKEFLEARYQGADIAGVIVSQAAVSNQHLEAIARYDKSGEFRKALQVVGENSVINKELSQKAIELSKSLEQMTLALARIRPNKARSLAQEAIVYEIGLIQHLINYSDLWAKLLEVLRIKFEKSLGNSFPQGNHEIEELIQEINKEVEAINEFNQKFSKTMTEFDHLTS